MPWFAFAIIGAVINAFVNLGYKTSAGNALFLFGGCVMAVAAVSMMAVGLGLRGDQFSTLTQGNTPWIILGMGVATPAILYCLINALTHGPIALADPFYACIYAVASVLIGVLLLRESPSAIAYGGIALYLMGAVLMARG